MPRAERGTPKAIANQQKSKGLQRLRWYCQVCEKQCRDENGFKCHVQSEAHVRQMSIVGENPHRHIANYSRQFMGDFLQLLRTTHGEKRVHANHFYASQYISNKSHIHMNATRWRNLTEFVTFLGISGICRVENTEKGWFISWIDTSPEAMKKRDANLKRERMEKGEADREDRLIKEQVERARQEAIEKALEDSEESANSGSVEPESMLDVDTEKDVETQDKRISAISITIQKPIVTAPTLALKKPFAKSVNPLKPSNPLASKKSDNPLKSSMKKDKKEETPVSNFNGKRPLPKAVEIMNEELARKKFRDQKYSREDREYSRGYDRQREVYVDRRGP
jgi:DNA/RNA-binding protein KIN17